MSVESIEFLNSAKEEIILEGEIHTRNAISRAYYSAYHCALQLNEKIPNHLGMVANVGAHEQLISKLVKCPTTSIGIKKEIADKVKSVGYVLRQAKTARHKADYDLSSDLEKSEAEAQLESTKILIGKITDVSLLLSSQDNSKLRSFT